MTPTDPNRIPHWLDCKSAMVPDLIAKNPKVMPVWEIAGTLEQFYIDYNMAF